MVQLLLEHAEARGIVVSNADAPIVQRRLHESTSRRCDVCTLDIQEDSGYYNCGVCNDGDFDICRECYHAGGRCLMEEHVVVENCDRTEGH